LKIIKQHNLDNTKSWKMGVNQFTDKTDDEFNLLLGLNKPLLHLQHHSDKKRAYVPFQSLDLPETVDWRERNIITPVKDQGECGSCWTFGTAENIESYWAMKTGQLSDLSEQQILDCTPNPQQCGGTGGCGGGTAQLAMDKIVEMGGISSEWDYPYTSYWGQGENCSFGHEMPAVKITGYVRLPENDQDSVLNAVASIGPQVINVEASTWKYYETGIFDGCNKTNPDVDHVVQLVGYGPGYWLVRNSWSPRWGELGYIKLKRESTAQCGIDLTPMDGDICSGGPSTVKVCGTCGVVYDVTYPTI